MIEIRKPSLESRPIHVREPGGGLPRQGRSFPVIRIRDAVLNPARIKRAILNVGAGFLPTLFILVEDSDARLREALKADIDYATFYAGSNADPYFVKLEFLIEGITGEPGRDSLAFDCSMHAPKLYAGGISAYKGGALGFAENLCAESGLGLISNLNSGMGSMAWVRDGCGAMEMLQRLCAHSGCGGYCTGFIDQYGYFVMADIAAAMRQSIPLMDSRPDGTALNPPQSLVLTNNPELGSPFLFSFWSLSDGYGRTAKNTAQVLNVASLDIADLASTAYTLSHSKEQAKEAGYSFAAETQGAPGYTKRGLSNEAGRASFNENTRLKIRMPIPIMALAPMGVCGVELYNTVKRAEVDGADGGGEDAMGAEASSKIIKYEKNTLLSGSYLILSIEFDYMPNGTAIQYAVISKI